MGRYYWGGIEGKWWFAVQPSDVPMRFGGHERSVEYSIGYDEDFKQTMEEIETELGDKLKMFDEFFSSTNGYVNEDLIEYFKNKYPSYNETNRKHDLREYADYQFGKDCIKYFKEHDEDYLIISSEL